MLSTLHHHCVLQLKWNTNTLNNDWLNLYAVILKVIRNSPFSLLCSIKTYLKAQKWLVLLFWLKNNCTCWAFVLEDIRLQSLEDHFCWNSCYIFFYSQVIVLLYRIKLTVKLYGKKGIRNTKDTSKILNEIKVFHPYLKNSKHEKKVKY